ncbi:MAG: hypothetical protein QXW10_04520 [Candidatus Micrarchaeaceae archaeon]
MNINLLKRRRKINDENDSRPVRIVEIGPNMWQIVYADESPSQYKGEN